MRITLTLVAATMLAGPAAAQLSLGPHGMSTPPINLVQLFRLAREIVGQVYNNFDESEAKDVSVVGNELNEISDEEDGTTDKTEAKCPPGEDCVAWLEQHTEPPTYRQDDIVDGAADGAAVDDNSPDYLTNIESSYIVVKWVMAYVAMIITCSILIIIISVPYLITGQTFRSFDSGLIPRVDQKDSLLLLTWLLGEASGDESCLERVLCLYPERSAHYLAIPNVISSHLYRLVPVRYQEQLRRLEEVTDNGLHYSCQKYSCPVLPEL